MSEWRRKASEMLPEMQRVISAAWSPMSLWIELRLEFEHAFGAGNNDVVQRILKYARWSWKARSSDTVTAVMCAFFEHLPEMEEMRAEIPKWFSASEFESLREVFSYHAGPEVIGALAAAYQSKGSAYAGKP